MSIRERNNDLIPANGDYNYAIMYSAFIPITQRPANEDDVMTNILGSGTRKGRKTYMPNL